MLVEPPPPQWAHVTRSPWARAAPAPARTRMAAASSGWRARRWNVASDGKLGSDVSVEIRVRRMAGLLRWIPPSRPGERGDEIVPAHVGRAAENRSELL